MHSAAWFLIVFGACYCLSGAWLLRHFSRIRDTWQPVTAVTEAVRIVSAKGRQRTVYSTEYDLRYRAEGRDYATPVARRGWTTSRSQAERIAQTYASGTQVAIWYDPRNPHAIRDDVGSIRLFFLPLLFGGLGITMLAIGILLYRRPVRYKRCKGCGYRSVAPYCGYCGREQPGDWPKPENPRGAWIGGSVFGAIGLALFAGSAWWMNREQTIFANWPEAEGTVVSREFERRNVQGKLSFESRVQFDYRAGDAQLRGFAEPERNSNYGWIRQRHDRFEPGTRHRVRYDPADPRRVRIDAGFELPRFAPALIFSAMGLLFGCIGWWLLRSLKWRPCAACGRRLPPRLRYCNQCGTPSLP